MSNISSKRRAVFTEKVTTFFSNAGKNRNELEFEFDKF